MVARVGEVERREQLEAALDARGGAHLVGVGVGVGVRVRVRVRFRG